MKIKIILLLAILLVLGCSTDFAQTDNNKGLVLTGDAGGRRVIEQGDVICYQIPLEMEFTNMGKEPIILFNPNLDFGKWLSKITYSGDNRKGKAETFSDNIERTKPDELRELAKDLDREKPPQNLTYILGPNQSVRFFDNFMIHSNFCDDFRIGKSERYYYDYKKTVEYKISLVKYHANPDLLEKLQKRWQKYGYLPVDKNGDFSVTFELKDK